MRPRPEGARGFQYIEHGVVHVDPPLNEGETLVYLGTPDRTVTPYDTYARLIARDARIAFLRSGIDAEVTVCHRRRASVGHGSGPGGSVRLGDDMIPPDVMAIVHAGDGGRALEAWEKYRSRRFQRKPVTVAGNLWYDQGAGAWRKGGTWHHVVGNAISIAKHLGRDVSRLEAYASRRKDRQPT